MSKGSACVKGYYSVQALYGRDRITRAMIRRDGVLVEVPLGEALDLVASKLRETVQQHGKDSVALYGSAQWTIPDAYVASKLFKGALGTNNVETSARLYAASAMAGLESSFGLDGAIGCYEDIDHADVFVLWDANLAETDPVLFSRMLDRRRATPRCASSTCPRAPRERVRRRPSLLHIPHRRWRSPTPSARRSSRGNGVDREFVDRYVAFKRGKTDIGYGLSDDALVADDAADATWDDYVAFLVDLHPEASAGAVRRAGREAFVGSRRSMRTARAR